MSQEISRTEFLRGAFFQRRTVLRPPWAVPEERFIPACEPCDKCRRACPERVLVEGWGGLPEVSFERGECTFCKACAEACPSGALSLRDMGGTAEADAPWTAKAIIHGSCFSPRGIACRVCEEKCDAGAITFKLAVGGGAIPTIEPSLCTGCGACVAPCPVNAIEVC